MDVRGVDVRELRLQHRCPLQSRGGLLLFPVRLERSCVLQLWGLIRRTEMP